MKLWIDDVRPAPEGYIWVRSVNEAKDIITRLEESKKSALENNNRVLYMAMMSDFPELNIDHDAGGYIGDGGDYIKLLDWLEEVDLGKYFTFHIHSQNPVGVENMRRIIKRNGWKEI